MVQRIPDVGTLVSWLNGVTQNLFWSICGVICLWVVLFLYLKERFDTKSAFVGSLWGVSFVAVFLYFAGLVSQTLVFILVVGAGLSLIAI